MTRFTFAFIVFLLAAHPSFGQHKFTRTNSGVVSAVPGTDSKETVTVTATGFGKKKPMSEEDCKVSAIYALLFRGIAGTQYNLPMIENEDIADEHNAVADLLDVKYNTFITSAEVISSEKKTRLVDKIKGIETTMKIVINCDALRRYLEQNNVIRKFGY